MLSTTWLSSTVSDTVSTLETVTVSATVEEVVTKSMPYSDGPSWKLGVVRGLDWAEGEAMSGVVWMGCQDRGG